MNKHSDVIVLEQILGNIPYFVFWKDRESVYLGSNSLFANAAGFKTPQDLVGKNDYDCSWKKEEAEFFRKIDQDVMNSGKSILNIEEPQRQADGSMCTLLTSKVPLFNSAGKVIGILGIFADITERKNLEIEKDLALERLESAKDTIVAQEKLASLGALSSGIAHEIRNPLNLIKSSAQVIHDTRDEFNRIFELIQSGKSTKEEIDFLKEELDILYKMSEIVLSNSTRIDNIITSMMTQARHGSSELLACDIGKMISEQVNLCYHSVKSDFKLNCLPVLELCEIEEMNIYPQDFSRVISNIVGNSFYALNEKKMVQGSDFSPSLFIKTHVLDNDLFITFKDNGVGIDCEVLNRVKEPFFTTKPTGKGTGLGLSMCNDIILQHDGEFIITSKKGEWTQSIIRIPIRRD